MDSKILRKMEQILWKMEHCRSKCSIFHNIFQNLSYQMRLKALVWSKGLKKRKIEDLT